MDLGVIVLIGLVIFVILLVIVFLAFPTAAVPTPNSQQRNAAQPSAFISPGLIEAKRTSNVNNVPLQVVTQNTAQQTGNAETGNAVTGNGTYPPQNIGQQSNIQQSNSTQQQQYILDHSKPITLGDMLDESSRKFFVNAGIINDTRDLDTSEELFISRGQHIDDCDIHQYIDQVWHMNGIFKGVNTRDKEVTITTPVRQTIKLSKKGGFVRKLGASRYWEWVKELDIGNLCVGYTSSGFFIVNKNYIKSITWYNNKGQPHTLIIEASERN